MSTLLPTLISLLQEYGYIALWLTIFCAAIGLPLPIGLVLLGAGAFAAIGDFNIGLLAIIAISASVTGDSVGYYLGRRLGGTRLISWLERKRRFSFISPLAVTRSRIYFQKRGAWAIFLSRFLFSALGSPINLLAGIELYPYRRFIIYDASGETIGVLIPLSLGFAFGDNWEAIGDLLGTSSLLVLALLIAGYSMYFLIRMVQRIRKEREKRSAAMGGNIVYAKIAKEKPDTLPL